MATTIHRGRYEGLGLKLPRIPRIRNEVGEAALPSLSKHAPALAAILIVRLRERASVLDGISLRLVGSH
jgi:hypothetical protein